MVAEFGPYNNLVRSHHTVLGVMREAGILGAHPPGLKTLKYEPLNTEKEEIRLISLSESSSSLVECRLEHACLSGQPTYKALSYCWGDANETKEIIVNGCTVKVTANLEEALRRLEQKTQGRFYGSTHSVSTKPMSKSEIYKFFE
jgi:hypothetical protein